MTVSSGGQPINAEIAQLQAAVRTWRVNRGDRAAKTAVQTAVAELAQQGIRQQEIAQQLGVPTSTVSGWKSDRPKPTVDGPARRDPTGQEIGRLRRLLNRVPYTGRHYQWASPAGKKFIAAGKDLVRQGVPRNGSPRKRALGRTRSLNGSRSPNA